MATINHRVRVKASAAEVFRALVEEDVLRPWRTNEPTLALRVIAVESPAHVEWRCVEGPAEWIGTHVRFDLARAGGETVLRLGHLNWADASDFMAECTTTWGRILLSLKARLEVPEAEDLYV